MGQVVYKIPRVNDEQIHRILVELGKEFGSFQVGIQIADSQMGQVVYPEAIDQNLTAVLSEKSELIYYFAGSIQGVSISYHRGGVQGDIWNKSPVFDDLAIDTQSFDLNRIKVAARTLELFRPVQLPRPADPISLLDSQRALQESSFSRLQLQLEKVFEQTIDLRSQLDEQVRGKEAALEQEFQQKALDAAQQLEKRVDQLAQEEKALDERRASLDESDNTFARRQIRDRMLNDVANRVQNFGLSHTTVAARWPVAIGMGILCLFLSCILFWTSYELYSLRGSAVAQGEAISATASAGPAPSPNTSSVSGSPSFSSLIGISNASSTERILLWLRFALASIGLAGSILYYIRWQNNWANTFATTEQSLQQFHIDVNRANWVVETCLEWRKETDSDIPAALIESLTRGLFVGREPQQAVLHPADELASALMGSASKLSLDINGNKLEIDKPSKIPKTVQAQSPLPAQSKT